MAEEKRTVKLPHNVILEDRGTLTVSGVSDVDSFDDQTVAVYTDMGELVVRGQDLHINKLNVETGELSMAGKIQSLAYNDDQPKGSGGGVFAKLFR